MKKLFIILTLSLFIGLNVYSNDYTTNYRLELPTVGQRDWGIIITNDIVSIDRVLKIISNDTIVENVKLTILSNDAVIQDTKLTILSNDAVIQDTKLTILSNDAAWSKSGTNVFLLTNTNNVGIGTTTPSSTFSIVPQAGDTLGVSIDSSISGMTTVMSIKDTLSTAGVSTKLFHLVGDSDADDGGPYNIVFTKLGRMGILSQDPAYPLSISSDVTGKFIDLMRGTTADWTIDYSNLATMGSSPMLRIGNNIDNGLSLYLDAVSGGQRLYIWSYAETLPDIPHTSKKPTFAVFGDILVGDIAAIESNPMQYFIRSDLNLPMTSTTNLYSARQMVNDTDGGAFIQLCPLSTDGGAVNDGKMIIAAYGKGTGISANSIMLKTRSAIGTVETRMIISGDGAVGVGIGSGNPTARFSVYNSNRNIDVISAEAAIGGYTATSLVAANTLDASSSYNLFKCITDSDGDNLGPSIKFLVRGDGNVGVGVSVPNEKLVVEGKISCDAVKLDIQTISPDVTSGVPCLVVSQDTAGVKHLNFYNGSAWQEVTLK